MSASPATAEELSLWATDPTARLAFTAFGGQRVLLLATDGAGMPGNLPAIQAWLRDLPCPSIAIATAPHPLAQACDTVVASLEAAQALIETIDKAPVAASVLTQLLRAIEPLDTQTALTMESLAYASVQAGPEFRAWRERAQTVAPPAEDGPAVLLHREGASLRLSLNRPDSRNAMTVAMRDALCEALQLVIADDSIQALQIDGRGKCFSTGGEPSEFGSVPDPATGHLIRGLSLPGKLLAACAERASVQLHGACIGSGIEFPAFAGHVRATPDAWFQLPELKYGLIPGAGGCHSITRRIGRQRTAWLALSGRRIDAVTALTWGLIDQIGAATSVP